MIIMDYDPEILCKLGIVIQEYDKKNLPDQYKEAVV